MIRIRTTLSDEDIENYGNCVADWALNNMKKQDKENSAAGCVGAPESLRNGGKETLKDILTLPLTKLEERRGWVKEYRETRTNGPSNGGLSKESQEDEWLKKVFHYESLKSVKITESDGRVWSANKWLQWKLRLRVCPYCNKQFIQVIDVSPEAASGDGVSEPNAVKPLGDLDHILPRSVYPLFALSIWNLIPSCKSCNLLKRNKKEPILNPYEDGFGDDCVLRLHLKSAAAIAGLGKPSDMEPRWEISPELRDEEKRGKIQNNLDAFLLNESYRNHEEELRLALKRKYLYRSDGYWKSLDNLKRPGLRPDFRTLYGVSLDSEKFSEEILSKAIYDVIYHN